MFLLIDNYDSFTFNLVQAFQVLGRGPEVLRNDDDRLPALAASPCLEAVCLSPGGGHPDKAGLCLEFLKLLPPKVPVLGVCLGHQILGRFAGAPVVVGPRIMHGKASHVVHDGQGLFKGLPQPLRAGRYHSLVVSEEDPKGAFTVTARAAEGEIMALRYVDRPWEGVQFHPESVLTPDGIRLLDNFLRSLPGSGEHSDNNDSRLPEELRSEAETTPASPPSPPSISQIMETLARGEDLSRSMARTGFSRLMDGEMSPAQAGAFLLALRAKGETPEEMAEAVDAVLERAIPVPLPKDAPVLDVVGTGGDGRSSFNCSTATALVLAALGHRVVKHGNRSVSSRCGSADVLERLGIGLDIAPQDVPATLERQGFVFLFAPRFHPAFQHIMPIRRELGIRTLFNLMGPLVNPSRPGLSFLGVGHKELLPLLAHTLARMNRGFGAVVHGAGGYDELTPMGPADIAFVRGSQVTFTTLDPARFGFSPCSPEDLAISGPEEGAAVLRELLQSKGPEPMRQMLALNIGFGLHLLHPERPMEACMAEAEAALAQGAGGAYLRRLVAEQEAERSRENREEQNAAPRERETTGGENPQTIARARAGGPHA